MRKTYDLTSEQMAFVEEPLDQLVEASGRIGRKDWLLMFVGGTFGVILSDILPPEGVRNFVTMAVRAVLHFHGWGLQPQLRP